ncbi:MAG: UDP-N-acetylglucosamine-peptide N-acetylglucosaminyltransferase [Alphaproteobacteria bacterium]|nr:UDP-N-acetylglucosamine-peptide N-acetylglucosaminyltransferase [Alphaproteobacteria bacterium]
MNPTENRDPATEEVLVMLESASRHADLCEWQDTLELCRQVLTRDKENVFALYLAGIASVQVKDSESAIEYLSASVCDSEADTSKLSILASLLLEAGRTDAAIPYLERWVLLSPMPESLNRLAAVYADHNRIGEAIVQFRRSLALQSDNNIASAGLYPLLRVTCEWGEELEILSEQIDRLNCAALKEGRPTPEPPFDNIHRVDERVQNLDVARSWSRQLSEAANDGEEFQYRPSRNPNAKIRVGYLSADFHDHATAHLMRGVFQAHDRESFSIHAYSHGPNDDSDYRDSIRASCDQFVDISAFNDEEAANLIHRDSIDILVDLKGHTRHNRLGICARRPASIQATYLGFPGTSGAEFFDYILTDKIVTPPETLECLGEKAVFLPNTYQCNDNTQEKLTDINNNYLYIRNKHSFIFCSFNNPIKIDFGFFQIWMSLLKSVPNSALWILQNNLRAKENLSHAATRAGVAPDRIVFAEMLPRARHLERMSCADLALDTQFYNGHTTTSDALWAGLPVLTMQGRHFASRVSSSLLLAMNLPELITVSPDEYAARAQHLATHAGELTRIRHKIAESRMSAALFDTIQFTSDLERGYREMWRRFVASQSPEVICVADLPT